MVFYNCNKKNPNCKTHNSPCFDCMHTTDPHYAKNGPCNFPEKHPERFESEVFDAGNGKLVTYYWERIESSNDI